MSVDDLYKKLKNIKKIGSHGKGIYSDLHFKTFNLDEEIFTGYSSLIVLAYKIDQDDVNDAIDSMIRKRDNNHSDYDCTTGNIHPCKKKIKGDFIVRQLVLSNNISDSHTGPKSVLKNRELPIGKDFPTTPRANFYPLINKNVKLNEYEAKKQEVLKNLWNKIPNDLKEINK